MPLGPTNPTRLPGRRWADASLRIVLVAKCLVTDSSCSIYIECYIGIKIRGDELFGSRWVSNFPILQRHQQDSVLLYPLEWNVFPVTLLIGIRILFQPLFEE